MKAGRPRDVEDAVSVPVVQRGMIDETYPWIGPDAPGIADELGYFLRDAAG